MALGHLTDEGDGAPLRAGGEIPGSPPGGARRPARRRPMALNRQHPFEAARLMP